MSKSLNILFVLLLSIKLVLSAMDGFIVNGTAVSILKYPHSAFIAIDCFNVQEKVIENFGCGASIINQNILLSAAHCYSTCDINRSKLSALVGETMRHKLVVKIVDIKIHEKHDEIDLSNDIALLLMKRPLEFSTRIKRVLLVKKPPNDMKAYVAGWGYVDEERQIESMGLNEAVQKVLPRKMCVSIFRYLPSGAMCASSIDGYSAEGDSGSALVLRRYIQIGLVSYKVVEVSRSIIIYTNVTNYINWIHLNSMKLQCKMTNWREKKLN